VSFYSVYVANHDILEGRETAEKTSYTVCGEAKILESTVRVFEIAGNTYDDQKITITTPGSISDMGQGRLGGTIGRDFLRNFDVILDSRNNRIALLNKQ
jgi:hypothetical protein